MSNEKLGTPDSFWDDDDDFLADGPDLDFEADLFDDADIEDVGLLTEEEEEE